VGRASGWPAGASASAVRGLAATCSNSTRTSRPAAASTAAPTRNASAYPWVCATAGSTPRRIRSPAISPDGESQPEEQALLADSVGLALLIVLETLTPDERLAFVLHDMFDLPFTEIAPIVDRTPAAAKQLASRARRRIQGASLPDPDPDPVRQRAVVDAFFAAARRGDFDALLSVLHPDVVARADYGALRPRLPVEVRGASAVARHALLGGALRNARLHPVLVNGAPGVVVTMRGRPFTVMSFTVIDGKISGIDTIGDPEHVRRIAAAVLCSK
jgi:Sigma-70, region 4/SnoaL-like domain